MTPQMLEEKPATTFGRRKVTPRACVADSKKHLRAFLTEVLEDLGFVTCECAKADDLATVLETRLPDLIVLGVSVDGIEAGKILETLVRRQFAGKVLAIGARDSIIVKAVRQVGEEYGLAMLPPLTTPFGAGTLRERVATLLPEEAAPSPAVNVSEALHAGWLELSQELIARNSAHEAYLYLQVTRGMEFGRSHAWPEGLKPTVFAYVTPLEPVPPALLEQGVSAVTAADTRWARRDIKSTSLLANILLKKLSADAGAFETILLENGELTEGSSTTVHVVKDGIIHIPPNDRHVLPGTTRDVVTELAARLGLPCASGRISEAKLRAADELWLAFSTRGVLPVTTLDGAAVGGGKPGPQFQRMRAAFDGYNRELTGTPAL